MVVKVVIDNRNRTISDLRHLHARGNLGENACGWQFDTLGYIAAPREGRDDDQIFEMAIEAGAENYEADTESIEFYTQPADLHAVSKNLQAAGVKPESVELIMKPKNPVADRKDAITVINWSKV
jgi:transcriptional/translational regulatory protein YebC/TACO1